MPPTKSQLESEPRFKIFTGALKAYTTPEGRKAIHCTASSNIEDLHGDTMTDDCVRDMSAQAIAKSMNIFLNHSYDVPEDVFGTTIGSDVVIRADGTTPYVDMDLDVRVDETNPRAVQTYAAIHGPNGDDGVKLGVSIGAMVEEWEFKDKEKGFWGGMTIKKVNLLEASIVGIPANPRSWVRNGVFAIGKSMGMEDSELKKMLDEAKAEIEAAMSDGNCPSCGHEANCTTDDSCACDNAFHAGAASEEPGERVADADTEITVEADGIAKEGIEVPLGESGELIVLSHNELPDSAFACIESGGKKDDEGKTTPRSLRHYPHHHADGSLDESLLRNALSRIGDKNNIQCGKSHLMSHARSAGIGEKTEEGFEVRLGDEIWIARDVDPEIEHEPEHSDDFDGDCHCSDPIDVENDLDLAPEGESQGSALEVALDLEGIKSGEALVDREVDADIVSMLTSLVALIERKNGEIEELIEERKALTDTVAERDADLALAAEVVEKLSKLPLSRKATAKTQLNSFHQKFAGVYSEPWLKLIDDRNKESSDGS
jgi:hypothetical protein